MAEIDHLSGSARSVSAARSLERRSLYCVVASIYLAAGSSRYIVVRAVSPSSLPPLLCGSFFFADGRRGEAGRDESPRAAKVPGSQAKTPSYYFYDPETSAGITIISPAAVYTHEFACMSR